MIFAQKLECTNRSTAVRLREGIDMIKYFLALNKFDKRNIFILCAAALVAILMCCQLTRDDLASAESAYFKKKYRMALKKFTALANAGDSEAQKYLGVMYFQGEGVSKDYETAAKWFTKASEQRNPRGQHYLAICYLSGLGVQRDFHKALNLEIDAASNRYNITKIKYQKTARLAGYGDMRMQGKEDAAERALQEKSNQDGMRKEPNTRTKAVLESFMSGSKNGKTEAAYLLGLTFSDGKRARPNIKEAARFFRKSANEGNVSAQTRLGMLYFFGDGVLQDFAEAAHWFNLAAMQGSKDAQFLLGNLYASGSGVPLDYVKAAALYAMAVENKHSLAKCYLAELFSKGLGVYQNIDIARILCQEGYNETDNDVCTLIWSANMLGKTDHETPGP